VSQQGLSSGAVVVVHTVISLL